MSSNAISRKVINHIIKQLASGTNIVLNKKKDNLLAYLTISQKNAWKIRNKSQTSKHLTRYMKQQGLITLKEQSKGKQKMQLTSAGMKRAHKIDLDEISIPHPKSWDRKWRIVIFDIPETQRQSRNRLVAKLKNLGFYQLHRSLWVYPFPCSIEIEYVKRAYRLTPYVSMAEVIKIDKQNQLLRHFKGLVPQKRIS